MSTPSFVSDPAIVRIPQLIRDIAQGFIQVPRFQRPIVWDDQQRLDLLSSIYEGTPLGSILVWRTSHKEKIKFFGKLGPHELEKPDDAQRPLVSYLLDGHQRLSTLFGALYQPKDPDLYDKPDAESNRWGIFFNLETTNFLFDAQRSGVDRQLLLPLWKVLVPAELVRFQRALGDRQNADELIEQSDRLATAIQEYRIPVIPIATDDIDVATKAFQRINSEGTKMSPVHMVAALTWSSSFDLAEKLLELKEEFLAPLGWGALDEKYILSTCKASLGLDLLEGDADVISKQLRKDVGSLEQATKNLARAAELLRERCDIRSPKILPYAYSPVLLAVAFHENPEPSREVLDRLEDWFWWSSYSFFAIGVNSSRLRWALEDVLVLAKGGEPKRVVGPVDEVDPLPKRFDFRQARCKLLALRMAIHQDEILGGEHARQTLAEQGPDALEYLIAPHQARKMNLKLGGYLYSPANRVLALGDQLAGLQNRLLNLKEVEPTESSAHLITETAIQLLGKSDLDFFFEQRLTSLQELEEDWLIHKKVVLPDPVRLAKRLIHFL